MRTLSVLGIEPVTVQPPPSLRSTSSGRRRAVYASGSAPAPPSTTTAPTSTLAPMRAWSLASYSSQMLLPSFYSDKPVRGANVSTLFMIVDICGQRPSITRAVGRRAHAWGMVVHASAMQAVVLERSARSPMLYLEVHRPAAYRYAWQWAACYHGQAVASNLIEAAGTESLG